MKRMSILVIIEFMIFIATQSCNNLSGHLGCSNTIKESKRRDVFISEYIPTNGNVCIINDTLKLTIKEAWIENSWRYDKNLDKTIILDGYQLCVNTLEEDIEGVDFDWSIGVNSDKYLRTSSNSSLIGDFKNIPPDTLIYPVQIGDSFSDYDIDKRIIIGNFMLIKKQ